MKLTNCFSIDIDFLIEKRCLQRIYKTILNEKNRKKLVIAVVIFYGFICIHIHMITRQSDGLNENNLFHFVNLDHTNCF